MPTKEEYWKDPDKYRAWTRMWAAAHRARANANARAHYERKRAEQGRVVNHRHNLTYKHRLSTDTYTTLLESQGGKCAVCRCDPPANGKSLHVDHCHTTGAIRGLLCNSCNCAIGNAKESAARLRELADYLERTPPDVPRIPRKRHSKHHQKDAP